MDWIQTQVRGREQEAERIIRLELTAVDGQPLPAFEPGAHVDVRIPDTDLVRQYSLINDPLDNSRYVLAIQKELESRGGSQTLFAHCQVGDHLWISPPRNRFQLDEQAPHHILIAGGIGVTPLLSMAQFLHRHEQSFVLHYSTRNRARTAFYDWLNKVGFADRVRFYHDDYQGHIAFNLRLALEDIDLRSRVYVCGPATLIRAVLAGARVVSLPQEQVRHEYFSLDGLQERQQGHENHPFTVTLARSQQTFTVGAEQTIVEGLRARGIDILVSCEEGICGTCVTGVLEGVVDHRDHYLLPEEKSSQQLMTPCCSRARGKHIVLDI